MPAQPEADKPMSNVNASAGASTEVVNLPIEHGSAAVVYCRRNSNGYLWYPTGAGTRGNPGHEAGQRDGTLPATP